MKRQMNSHPNSLVTLPIRARFGLVSLFGATLLVCLLASATNVKAQQPTWKPTGSLGTARNGHTGTLLANGNVLVAGGTLGNPDYHPGSLNSAELYDPATGRWSLTGNLNTARAFHTATLLPNGKVLVLGGAEDNASRERVDSAELYDPATGTWSITGNLNTAGGGTATLLTDGKVLVAGGFNNTQRASLTSAELYDPATGTWSITGNLNTARNAHTATLLSDGKVLVAGGYNRAALTSAELFDPATGTWSITGNLNTADGFTATLLPNGKVLVTGYNSAELYDPATGTWSITGNLNAFRTDYTATLLPSGKVMVAAGCDENYHTILPAELYDPTTGMWSYTGSLNTGRGSHTMILLPDGKVLVAGGLDTYGYDTLNSAELFDTSQIKSPQVTGASISGKKLFVEGKDFDVGAKIILNDEMHKSANDELTPTTLLVGKKAGRWIGLGETVRLKVRNSDGTESPEFSFTRPAG